MPAIDTAADLASFPRRGAGSNAERLAAQWLCEQIASPRRDATAETFWSRPNWALSHAWHAVLGVAGSLVMVSDAKLGGGLVLLALVSLALDAITGRSLGRRLSPEHASQNVVSRPRPTPADNDDRVHLIITANYDAGRVALAYRPGLRRLAARARRLLGGRLTPGWLGWLAIWLLWLLAVAIARNAGATGSAAGVLQLVPTVALVLSLALLLEIAVADFGPAANDNASGTAVALALARALDAAPPRHMTVELVLQGAGDGAMIGLSRHLRARRRELTARNAVVLGIAPCGAGAPRWWIGDGPLVPLRFHRRLRDLAAGLAPDFDVRPHRGRGTSPAFPARLAGLPAINVGCLDTDGLPPQSHQPNDLPEHLNAGALDGLLQFAVVLVEAIDGDLARTRPPTPATAPAHL